MESDKHFHTNPVLVLVGVGVLCVSWLAGCDGESNDAPPAAAVTAPPPAPSPPTTPAAAQETGKIDVVVTWGSAGRIAADAGAVVYFLPAGSVPRVPGIVLSDRDARGTLEIRREAAAKVGGHVGVVGGDGHVILDRVKPGKYWGMIISANASAPPGDGNRMTLSAYVDDVEATHTAGRKMLHSVSVHVVAGDTAHANHHFEPI